MEHRTTDAERSAKFFNRIRLFFEFHVTSLCGQQLHSKAVKTHPK
jgi:hypothetical protein